MASGCARLDFFGEDAGHELFFRALARRLATEVGLAPLEIRTRSARGGHGRAITELRGSLKVEIEARGQLLVVLIDSNDVGWFAQRKEIERAIRPGTYPHVVIGCPEPEVEAWLIADPRAWIDSIGVQLHGAPSSDPIDSKRVVRESLERAAIPVLSDPMEIAYDVVPCIDLHRAGKANASLRHFHEDLRDAFVRLRDA